MSVTVNMLFILPTQIDLASIVYLFVTLRSLIVWIILEDDNSLQYTADTENLFCPQFSPFFGTDQDRSGVRLESSNGLGFTCLANSLYGLTNSYIYWPPR